MRVIVTGASRGIGRAIVAHLVARGDEVAAVSRSDTSGIEGESVTVYRRDLANCADFDALIAEIAEDGEVDAVVNNAGISPVFTSAEKIAPDVWREVIHMNLTVPFLVSQAFARRVIAEGREGSIVMVSSIGAAVGLKRLAAYTASKAGLTGLTRTLALDWADRGIRVNAVEPGFVATDMTEGIRQNPRLMAGVTGRIAQGRLAEAREIAEVVSFLLSPAASYMTGASIRVDGGYTAG